MISSVSKAGATAQATLPSWYIGLKQKLSGLYFAKQQVKLLAVEKSNDNFVQAFKDTYPGEALAPTRPTVTLPYHMSMRKAMPPTAQPAQNRELQSSASGGIITDEINARDNSFSDNDRVVTHTRTTQGGNFKI